MPAHPTNRLREMDLRAAIACSRAAEDADMKPLGIALMLVATARDRDRSRKGPLPCDSFADAACESSPMAYERVCDRLYHECLCQGRRKFAAVYRSRWRC